MPESEIKPGQHAFSYPDSSLNDLDLTDRPGETLFNHLGLSGSACNSRTFSENNGLFSVAGPVSYRPYLHTPQLTSYYRSNKHFSQMDYHLGSFKEQEIRLLHTQNILKNWSAGFDFHRLSIKDYTRNSDVFHSNFSLFTWYESLNKRYALIGNGILNTIRNQVNGGLSDDSLYINSNVENLNLKGLATPLSDAQNRIKDNFIYLRQYLKINSDSANAGIYLQHSFEAEKYSFAYQDVNPDSGFYQNFYKGASAYDSLGSVSYTNKAGILYNLNNIAKGNLEVKAQVGLQNLDYKNELESSWHNLFFDGNISWKEKAGWFGSIDFKHVLEGRDESNFDLAAKIKSPTGKFGNFETGISRSQHSPDYLFHFYSGNHFYWMNDWSPVQISKASLHYNLPNRHLEAGADYTLVDNYTYFDESALPDQHYKKESVFNSFIRKQIHWRSLRFSTELHFQHTGNKDVIPIPEFYTSNTLAYEGRFFKNALLGQTGFHLNYYSIYYAPAFMPATGSFYLQTDRECGGYAMLDFFINIKIKTARLFLKLENLGDGIWADYYYQTPYYPEAGRTFKFGISWRFYDN